MMGKALSGELSCPCDRSCLARVFTEWQTVQTLIKLLVNQTLGLSDLGLHCLLWYLGYYNAVKPISEVTKGTNKMWLFDTSDL